MNVSLKILSGFLLTDIDTCSILVICNLNLRNFFDFMLGLAFANNDSTSQTVVSRHKYPVVSCVKCGDTMAKSGPTFKLSCKQAYSVEMQSWTVISQQKYPVVSHLEMLKRMLEQGSLPHNNNIIFNLLFSLSFDLFIDCWTIIIQILLNTHFKQRRSYVRIPGQDVCVMELYFHFGQQTFL